MNIMAFSCAALLKASVHDQLVYLHQILAQAWRSSSSEAFNTVMHPVLCRYHCKHIASLLPYCQGCITMSEYSWSLLRVMPAFIAIPAGVASLTLVALLRNPKMLFGTQV